MLQNDGMTPSAKIIKELFNNGGPKLTPYKSNNILKSIDKPKIKKMPLEIIMDKLPENVENIILKFFRY
jgi:hypothetical protein